MINIWIVTLFPEYFQPLLQCGVVGRALQEDSALPLRLRFINLRDYAEGKYKSVDDYPYGGGPGMILRADILKNALLKGIGAHKGIAEDDVATFKKHFRVIYPSPRGPLWGVESCQKMAQELTAATKGEEREDQRELVFICGRYEGIDERFIENYVDAQICLGNFIISGGEIAVLAILDSALRYVPGVLGNDMGAYDESFDHSLLECPQYTKPRLFDGKDVPEILLSGHHARIQVYQKAEKIRLTKIHRPDLWENYREQK